MENINNTDEIEFMLGENIKRIRLLKNITREELASQAGISITALKNLETGHGATIKTLVKVVRVLNKVEWIQSLAPVATINPLTMLRVQEQRGQWGQPRLRQRARPVDKSKK